MDGGAGGGLSPIIIFGPSDKVLILAANFWVFHKSAPNVLKIALGKFMAYQQNYRILFVIIVNILWVLH